MSTSEPAPPDGAVAKEPVRPRASIRPHDDGGEIKPWDDDHTALVHVLWHCHHAGLTLKDDFDEVASQIRQSKYHRAVVAAAFQAGALQNAVPDASLSAPPAQSAAGAELLPEALNRPNSSKDAAGPSCPPAFPSDSE